ncbi:MAG: oxidoreductase [Fluviicola sp.]|nr:oxidoreductase [Fluviicola sp.]
MPNAPKWALDIAERLMPKLPLMVVSDTEFLSPSVKRIRFKGDFNKLNFQVGSYMDFRVSDTEIRKYTVSYVDTKKGVLEFIAHLHGEASGSQFISHLQVGDKIKINQPRAYKYYIESIKNQVIFGDETSLGLACSFLPLLKQNSHQFQFYFELDEANKNLPKLLNLENYTVFPKNESFRNEKWISNLPVFQESEWQEANFVLTGNVKSTQAFRRVLKNKTKSRVFLHGYWLEGKKGL